MYRPTRPEVSFTPVVMIDSLLGRGRSAHQAGRRLVEAERDAERGADEEVDPQHLRRRERLAGGDVQQASRRGT